MRMALAAFAALLATGSQALAQTGGKCLTRAEAEGLFGYALPSVIDGLRVKCVPSLGANSAFARLAPGMIARYRPEADRRWPAAKAAFGKMSDAAILDSLGDDGARKLLDATSGVAVAQRVKIEDCAMIDRAIEALEPLPPRNMAMLVSLLVEAGSRDESGKAGGFNICKSR